MANKGSTSNPGNFANDKTKASEAGKKGGQASGGNAGGMHKPEAKPDTSRKPSGGGRS